MCIVKYVPGHKCCHCQVHLHRLLPVLCVCVCRSGWVYARVLMTVNSDGFGGKGGAITLGLSMGLPEEGHAPVFFKTDDEGKHGSRSVFASYRFSRHFCSQRAQTSGYFFMFREQRPPARNVENMESVSARSRLRCLVQKILNVTGKIRLQRTSSR